MAKKLANGHIILENVRVSYPNLFKNDPQYGYNMTCILDPERNVDEIKLLKEEMARLEAEVLNKKCPKKQMYKLLKEGTKYKEGVEEYDGQYLVTPRDKKNRPVVMEADGSVVGEEESSIYAGCFADVKINPWAMTHKEYGPMHSANLVAIRFRAHGEPFGTAPVSEEEASDGFDVSEESEDSFLD